MSVIRATFICLFGFLTVFADNGTPAPAAKAPPGAPEKPASAGTGAGTSAGKAAEAKPANKEKSPPGENVTATETEIKFPGLTINRKTYQIRMDATVCLDSGILEYLVCLPETFEHEAIFVTKVKPEILHTALLLIGLKPTPMPPGLEALWWDKALKSNKSRVRIEVEWDINGTVERANITDLVRNRAGNAEDMYDYDEPETQEEVEDVSDAWVFTGSFVHTRKDGERVYAANLGGVVVGIWPNPTTVIQYGKESGNPYRGASLGMEVNDEFVPEKGTKVKLVFSKYVPPKDEFLEK